MMSKFYIQIITKSHAGTLSRVLSLFSNRGISVATVSSGPFIGTPYERVVLGVHTVQSQIDIIGHQIGKLYDTIDVTIIDENGLELETLIVKIRGTTEQFKDVKNVLQQEEVHYILESATLLILGQVGTTSELKRLVERVQQYEDIELIYTGVIGITKNEL